MFPVAAAILLSQDTVWPLTRAERTNYTETSHYSDVVDFMTALEATDSSMVLKWIGSSTEGRKIPLAIISYPPVKSAEEARKSGRPVIYIQGNIHAGEVEGKESAQKLLRRLCQEAAALKNKKKVDGPTLVNKMVFLVNPIYNADGNEKFAAVERNRPEQDGPAMVGVRANGGGFDLNRDAIKAETPEMNVALQSIYNSWEPDLMMDLHTTDGTRHGWDLTYAPPTNPNTDPGIMKYSRDELLPTVRAQYRKLYSLDLFDYGNAAKPKDQPMRWETFGHEGRYVTNYVGLRNRVAILSEAITYLPFKDRVISTDRFMTLILEKVAKDGKRVIKLGQDADKRMNDWANMGQELGVRFVMAKRKNQEAVPLEKQPGKREKKPEQIEWVKMDVYDRWNATKTATFPRAYLIPASETATIQLLQKHGVKFSKLTSAWSGKAMTFQITTANQAGFAFQGHKLWTLDGTFKESNVSAAAGDVVVPTNQHLGVLAFHILEPESTDGAAAWGFMGDFKTGQEFSVRKIFVPMKAKLTPESE